MYGAILGDIVGSPYEFACNNYKAKDFPLFSRHSDFTDDTVMTLAVAKVLRSTRGQDDAAIKTALVHEMQHLGRAYPDRGYGTHFGGWLYEDDPQPYQSYGNGSAMRVSPAAWLATDMAETLRLARLTAQVTHDHPEGIKGAQATAAAIFLARTGHGKEEIKAYVVREEYNLPLTKEAYIHLVQKIDGRLIEKTRYLIPLDGGLTAELDVFEGDLAPLTLVEVEFDSVDAANEFVAPDWFGEDVTESGKYHNSYLSRLENS